MYIYVLLCNERDRYLEYGCKIAGRNNSNLGYADDTALLVNDLTTMKKISYRVNAAGLRLKSKKTTEFLHVHKRQKDQKLK